MRELFFDQIDFLVDDSLHNHCIDILTDSTVSIELREDRQSFMLSNLVDSVVVGLKEKIMKKENFHYLD